MDRSLDTDREVLTDYNDNCNDKHNDNDSDNDNDKERTVAS